jgi:hypothetical protein
MSAKQAAETVKRLEPARRYWLQQTPADFDDLCGLCVAFKPTLEVDPVTLGVLDSGYSFPVGPAGPTRAYAEPEVISEADPILFKTQAQGVAEYGLVEGRILTIYQSLTAGSSAAMS